MLFRATRYHRFLSKLADATALAHIAGASGAGKTTILQKIKEAYPQVVVKDLDEIDDEAERAAELSGKVKDEWTDEEFLQHQSKRQELLNQFVSDNAGSPIVLAGYHSEGAGQYAINVPTANKFLLDVDAETAAQRAYQRSLTEDPKYRRTLEELPQDIEEAQGDIEAFTTMGYAPRSPEWILNWVGFMVK